MNYLLASDGIVKKYPYSIQELKKDNPNISFPSYLSNSFLAEWNVYPYTILSPPNYDPITQSISTNPPSKTESGDWVINYAVNLLPENEAANNVREKRDNLLTESDWTQVIDAPVNQKDWAGYRQILRELPKQHSFPYEVTWPEKPI